MSHIKSYEDLLEEKRRLETELMVHKELIRQDLDVLREDFKPVQQILTTAGKMTSPRTDNPLLRGGINILGDFLIKGAVIAGGGWVTRLIAPMVVDKITDFFIKRKKPIPTKNWLGNLIHGNGRSK